MIWAIEAKQSIENVKNLYLKCKYYTYVYFGSLIEATMVNILKYIQLCLTLE